MADQAVLWQWMINALEKHQVTALLVVIDSHGSSPGKIGAKMAITDDKSIGTIGGGALEYKMVNTARELLASYSLGSHVFRFAHHASSSVQPSGAICGGEQTVLVYCCRQDDLSLFEKILEGYRTGARFELIISIDSISITASSQASAFARFSDGENWQYREILGVRNNAYIVGGGHISLALSKVLNWLNFDITVIDERELLTSMQENAFARQKWHIPYQNIAEHIPEGRNVFVFIMTHSHHTDELVVASLAQKHFAYLGLLGSQNKISKLKTSLAGRLPAEQLQTLHAPMGLAIKSHTPEEIAISIAAELIQLINLERLSSHTNIK